MCCAIHRCLRRGLISVPRTRPRWPKATSCASTHKPQWRAAATGGKPSSGVSSMCVLPRWMRTMDVPAPPGFHSCHRTHFQVIVLSRAADGRVEPTLFQRLLQRLDLHHRSEEHTSELQSLMRTSYSVFCLKKKNSTNYIKNKTAY